MFEFHVLWRTVCTVWKKMSTYNNRLYSERAAYNPGIFQGGCVNNDASVPWLFQSLGEYTTGK